MGISPLAFYRLLVDSNITFFTGVPDSLLNEFGACIDDNTSEARHIIAANEGNAIAIAAGYNLGTGELPLVYMQNSGFGNAVNPLLSLCDPEVYSIPMIVMIGWRGEPGLQDAVQHVKDGRIQLDLLKVMEIPYEIISKDEHDFKGKVHKGIEMASKGNRPFVLLIKKGTFDQYRKKSARTNGSLMLREEALDTVLNRLGSDSVVVSTTGKTSREVFEIRERNRDPHFRDFLTVGSMGHCSSIALGIAITNQERKVICIDGDGALIMHMGGLATIGKVKPKNIKHILINNKVHESVGGQETAAKFIDIPGLVKSNGYKNVYSVQSKEQLVAMFDKFIQSEGPSFLEINVKPGSREDIGRPTIQLKDYKEEFMEFLNDR